MSYRLLTFRIVGVSPLLMHNGQTADPLNKFAQAMKKVSGKRNKTEDDYKELAHIEFMAGLYLKNGKPCLPGFVLESALVASARKSRRGKQALAGIIVPDDALLEYDGPQDLEELWSDERFRLSTAVCINGKKVIRTRPRFDNWACNIRVMFDPKALNDSDIKDLLVTAGEDIGLCDWRPKFGRFSVE